VERQWLLLRRIQQAKTLLLESSITAAEIAAFADLPIRAI
jgi:AraC-like DNA-binding protein